MISDQNPHPGDICHSQIPVGCRSPPPLGLDIDRCIIIRLWCCDRYASFTFTCKYFRRRLTTTIGHFRYIKIQLDSEAWHKQKQWINLPGHLISFVRLAPSSCSIRCQSSPSSCHSCSLRFIIISLAPVVQRLDNAIHRINHYPADKC